MKNLFSVALLATALFTATLGNAQTVKKDAKTVGHKTAEVTDKGYAAVTDKRYKGKTGPLVKIFTLTKTRIIFM